MAINRRLFRRAPGPASIGRAAAVQKSCGSAFPQDAIKLPGTDFSQVGFRKLYLGPIDNQNGRAPRPTEVCGEDGIAAPEVWRQVFGHSIGDAPVPKLDHAGTAIADLMRSRVYLDRLFEALSSIGTQMRVKPIISPRPGVAGLRPVRILKIFSPAPLRKVDGNPFAFLTPFFRQSQRVPTPSEFLSQPPSHR